MGDKDTAATADAPTAEDTEYTDTPICPHCGHVDLDYWEHSGIMDDGANTEVDCPHCSKTFLCETMVSYDFTTTILLQKEQ